MQRTHNRKSVLGDNPFATAEREAPEATAVRATTRSQASSGTPRAPRRGGTNSKAASAVPPARKTERKAKVEHKAAKAARASIPPAQPAVVEQPAASLAEVHEPAAASPNLPPPEPATDLPAGVESPTQGDVDASDELERKRAVEAKIREIESRIETMSGEGTPRAAEHRERTGAARRAKTDEARSDGGVLDTAREMLSSDYYLRQWGRIGMRNRSDVVDEFGYDPTYDKRVRPILEAMYARYFRATTEGIEHVPSTGRALIVVNHSGTFPYDGVMLKTAVRKEHPAARELRWLSEDQIFYLPFVGSFITRLGSVRACQENAERLLANDNLVAVFPEGAKGAGRLYRDRYRLQRFGRGGFIRLCLRTRTPIVPCVIVGAEESMPLMMRVEYLTGPLGLPYLPITPTFPLLGPLGLLPAPTRWSFSFGPPIELEGYGPESADDNVLVGRLTERVRATMQTMLDRALSARRSVWFG